MLKRIISIVLLLFLMFSIPVMAENQNAVSEETGPEAAGQVTQGERGEMGMRSSGNMPPRGTPPSMPNGEMPPEGMSRGQRPQGEFTPPQNNSSNNNTEATTPQTDTNTSTENSQMPNGNSQFGGQIPEGMGRFPGNMQNTNQNTQAEQPTGFSGFVKTYSTPITSVILLILAFIFVIFYKRKNY